MVEHLIGVHQVALHQVVLHQVVQVLVGEVHQMMIIIQVQVQAIVHLHEAVLPVLLIVHHPGAAHPAQAAGVQVVEEDSFYEFMT